MIIEKRKKGEEKWEEITLKQLTEDINGIWTKWFRDASEKCFDGTPPLHTTMPDGSPYPPTEAYILYTALDISLHRKYETNEAEYRIS